MAYFDTRDRRSWEGFLELFAKPSLPGFVNWFGDWGVSPAYIYAAIYVGLLGVLAHLVPNLPLFALEWLVGTAPVWLPAGLAIAAWNMHFSQIHAEFISKKHPVLLELRMPPDVVKSPRAMELALNQLYNTGGETTFIDRWWKGNVRLWYSFELVSIGGEIHYYVWTWKINKSNIENIFYSFFPEMEIVEVDDYATRQSYDPAKNIIWCTDWRLEPLRVTADGHSGWENAFPIKSYIDFELDKDPKEEFKIDPLALMLEYMSNIKPDEQLWVQLLVRGHGSEFIRTGPFKYVPRWNYLVDQAIESIRVEALKIPGGKVADPKNPKSDELLHVPNYTWRQTEQIRTIERHYAKNTFDFMARGAYITTPKSFHAPTIGWLRFIWMPYASQWMSALKPKRWLNIFDYPWQDYKNMRKDLHVRRFLDAYRRRSAFYPPWRTPHNIVTAETLATIYHFPSRGVAATGLRRMPSTKAEPPSNLPR